MPAGNTALLLKKENKEEKTKKKEDKLSLPVSLHTHSSHQYNHACLKLDISSWCYLVISPLPEFANWESILFDSVAAPWRIARLAPILRLAGYFLLRVFRQLDKWHARDLQNHRDRLLHYRSPGVPPLLPHRSQASSMQMKDHIFLLLSNAGLQ